MESWKTHYITVRQKNTGSEACLDGTDTLKNVNESIWDIYYIFIILYIVYHFIYYFMTDEK